MYIETRSDYQNRSLVIFVAFPNSMLSTMVVWPWTSIHSRHRQSSETYTHTQQKTSSSAPSPSSRPSALGSNSPSTPLQTSQHLRKPATTMACSPSPYLFLTPIHQYHLGFGNIGKWEFWGWVCPWAPELICSWYGRSSQLGELQPWERKKENRRKVVGF